MGKHSKDTCGACEMPKCQDSTPEPTPAPTHHQEQGCEDWCYEGYDCFDAESNWGGEECGDCDIPLCQDDAQVRTTPEPTPAPTPHQDQGCEDWCYEELDCIDPDDKWCGDCDIPLCQDDAQDQIGCEDWCYEELDCLDPDEKWGYGEWFMEECGDCDRERLPLCEDGQTW